MKNKNSQYLLSAITLQKNKRKVNIFLNGQYAFSLSLLDLQKQGLKQGIYLDEADIARLKNLANFDLLYQKALGLLALRPRSAAEIEFSLKRYAQKKTITEDVDKIKRAVLLKLEKKNYLNDKEFAAWWIRQRQTQTISGAIKLRYELLQKGIDRKIIDAVLAENIDSQENCKIQTILAKKLKIWAGLPYFKKRKKCLDFLLRRGFNYGQAKEAVDQYCKKD